MKCLRCSSPLALCLAASVLLFTAAVVAKDFSASDLPAVSNPRSYPIHEAHEDEHVAIALDPYIGEEKEKPLRISFGKFALLPLRLIITNEGDTPISLVKMKVQFITSHNEKQSPASLDDLERRLASAPKSTIPINPLPIPLPRRKQKRISTSMEEELEYLQFKAKAVEAHSTQSGFVIFDTRGMSQPLAGSHVYIDGINSSEGRDLFYFDLPLDKAAAAAKSPAK